MGVAARLRPRSPPRAGRSEFRQEIEVCGLAKDMNFAQELKDIFDDQGPLFGAVRHQRLGRQAALLSLCCLDN